MLGQFPVFDGPYSAVPNVWEQLAAKEAKIEALDKENIVMRQQMVKLIDERDKLLEALLALRSVIHTVHVDMGGYHRYGISNGSPTGNAIMLADNALKEVG